MSDLRDKKEQLLRTWLYGLIAGNFYGGVPNSNADAQKVVDVGNEIIEFIKDQKINILDK